MIEKILGISDSRPPGRKLTNSEVKIFSRDFEVEEDVIKDPYGLEGRYFFYKKNNKYIRCYKNDNIDCLILATELQDKLSYYGLAPKVINEYCSENQYINVSEYKYPIKNEINKKHLSDRIDSLHHRFTCILKKWNKGRVAIVENTILMHEMLVEHSYQMLDEYEIQPVFMSNFYEVLSWIKKQDGYGHGDMHPGNILYDNEEYLFIDFESVFQSKGGAFIDFVNLNRFGIQMASPSEKKTKIERYLYVKNAAVNHYLESLGKYVPLREREKFLREICK